MREMGIHWPPVKAILPFMVGLVLCLSAEGIWPAAKWSGGRLGLVGAGLVNTGTVDPYIPAKFGPLIVYEQGLDWVYKKRRLYYPGARAELGYLFSESAGVSFGQVLLSVGPSWQLDQWPVPGWFQTGFLVGPSLLSVTSAKVESTGGAFHSQIFWEYYFPIGPVEASGGLRAGMIFDSDVPLGSFGLTLGAMYRLF